MIDKKLLKLLGGNKKYIFYTVALMIVGLFSNITITACICRAIKLAVEYDTHSGGAIIFLWPAVIALIGIAVRYTATRLVGDLKDILGRNAKKDLRERMYNKIVRLGVRSTDGMSMAGLTQVSMEGVEQLAGTTIMDLVAYGGAGLGIAFAVPGVINRGSSPFVALFLILVAVDFFLPLRAFGSAFHVAMNGASAGNKILSLLEQPDPIWVNGEVIDTELKLRKSYLHFSARHACRRSVTDEEIYAALEKVNLAGFIHDHGGLDKVITEDAANISGGQKQRLALAVNLVANKDIYVFDEATSNIDIEIEAIIMSNIKELSKTKSVIVMSHRPANVVPSDLIYYMESGGVKECGTHGNRILL